MKLHQAPIGNRNTFTAIEADHVVVNHQHRILTSHLISPHQLQAWALTSIEDLGQSSCAELLEWQPELILLGTGARLNFPHPRQYQWLLAAGVGIEFMDNHAACRTYNVLMQEDRKVLVGLIFPART